MIRLAVRCRPELAEQVVAELVDLAPGGVEERHADGYVELAIYGAPGELPELPDLEAAAGDGLIQVTSTEVADDWAERWREFHRPVAIAGGRIVVRPPWSRPDEIATPVAATEVVVDPGRAFGTGAHPTTRLCLELMLDRADAGRAGGPLVDLGTGSAVLAIAAAKLGWGPVLGVDSEAAAIEAARANAEANGAEAELRRVNLRTETVPIAATVVANLTAPLLIDVARRIEAGSVSVPGPDRNDPPALPRALICSGLLAREAERVAGAFDRAGFAVLERRERGEWGALRLAPADSAFSDLGAG